MVIDQSYLVEVWPDGMSSENRFSLLMTRPFLHPGAKHGVASDSVRSAADSSAGAATSR
jgi:hypothetical protein